MRREELKGLRYVNYLRCSTPGQADTSIEDQKRVNTDFAQRHGMIHVKDVVLAGVSGSKTFNRKAIKQLIEEKKRNPRSFDVILVHDMSRFTRGGVSDGHALRRRLRAAGVHVISVMDVIPDGDEGELFESLIDYNNNHFSKALARTVARALFGSLQAKRRPPCGRVPYGFDKQYYLSNGQPTRTVRVQADGTRLVLDPRTGTVKETVPPHVSFRKMGHELSRLVVGDRKRVETVRWMFHQHYRKGLGWYRISVALNAQGVPSATGGQWTPETVREVLFNPIYLGRLIGCRTTLGVYYCVSPGEPKRSPIDMAQLEDGSRWSMPKKRRPPEEWIETYDPELAKILDDGLVRKRAAAAIQKRLDAWMLPIRERNRPTSQRHCQSSFFLKAVLKLKGLGLPMRGLAVSRPPNRHRYYVVATAYQHHLTSRPDLRVMTPADELETMVLEILRDAFLDHAYVKAAVQQYAREFSSQRNAGDDRAKLLAEDKRLARQLSFIYQTVTVQTEVENRSLINRIEQRRAEIEAMLANGTLVEPELDPSVISSRVLKHLPKLATNASGEVLERLRHVVNSVTDKLTVDPKTRQVEFSVRLPSWAMIKREEDARPDAVYPNQKSESGFSGQAKHRKGPVLLRYSGVIPFYHGPDPKDRPRSRFSWRRAG